MKLTWEKFGDIYMLLIDGEDSPWRIFRHEGNAHGEHRIVWDCWDGKADDYLCSCTRLRNAKEWVETKLTANEKDKQ